MKPPCEDCRWFLNRGKGYAHLCQHPERSWSTAKIERSWTGECTATGKNFEPKKGEKSSGQTVG